jgi:hypothetical protein
MLRRGLAGRAKLDLVIGVHAANKQLAVPLDHLRDPQAFDDIGAEAEDGRLGFRVQGELGLCVNDLL